MLSKLTRRSVRSDSPLPGGQTVSSTSLRSVFVATGNAPTDDGSEALRQAALHISGSEPKPGLKGFLLGTTSLQSAGITAAGLIPGYPLATLALGGADEPRSQELLTLRPTMAQTAARRDTEIKAICAMEDPVRRNVAITVALSEVGRDLQTVLGPAAGVNFVSWSVWGSKRVGSVMRQEDLPNAGAYFGAVGGPVGAALGETLGKGMGALMHPVLNQSSSIVAEGNRQVMAKLGPVFNSFIGAFGDAPVPDERKWTKFAEQFKPGSFDEGGDDMLKAACRSFYEARYQDDPKKKQELTLLGNLRALHYEQQLVQGPLKDSMPAGTRHLATAAMIRVQFGEKVLWLGKNVRAYEGMTVPDDVENEDLRDMLASFQLEPGELGHTRARDWSRYADRLKYTGALMEAHHLDPSIVMIDPFTPQEVEGILNGQKLPAPVSLVPNDTKRRTP